MLAQNIISTISSWIPVSLFTILGVVAVDVFKYIVKNFLDYRSHKKEQNHQYELNLELERFKISWQENLNKQEQEFQSAMERMKYDFNRYAEDFNLYTTKRHESYLKIHQALLDAESQVLQLRGFIQIPDFSKYTKEEISIWLDEKHFTEKQKYPVLNNWENNRKEAMKNVNDLFQLSRHHDANTSCNNAKNFVLDYQLYLSEKIFTDCLELTKKIKHLLINYDPTFCYAANKHNESEKLRKEIEDIFTRITIQMKKELQRGYYDEG